jgi:hypothetical protein
MLGADDPEIEILQYLADTEVKRNISGESSVGVLLSTVVQVELLVEYWTVTVTDFEPNSCAAIPQ